MQGEDPRPYRTFSEVLEETVAQIDRSFPAAASFPETVQWAANDVAKVVWSEQCSYDHDSVREAEDPLYPGRICVEWRRDQGYLGDYGMDKVEVRELIVQLNNALGDDAFLLAEVKGPVDPAGVMARSRMARDRARITRIADDGKLENATGPDPDTV